MRTRGFASPVFTGFALFKMGESRELTVRRGCEGVKTNSNDAARTE